MSAVFGAGPMFTTPRFMSLKLTQSTKRCYPTLDFQMTLRLVRLSKDVIIGVLRLYLAKSNHLVCDENDLHSDQTQEHLVNKMEPNLKAHEAAFASDCHA